VSNPQNLFRRPEKLFPVRRETHDLLASQRRLRSDGLVLRWLKRRGAVHFVIVALFVVPMVGLLFSSQYEKYSPFLAWAKGKFDSLEFASVDYRVSLGRKAPVSPEIVFLAIDAASTSASLDSLYDAKALAASRPLTLMHSSFPYPREVYALVCDRLFEAGARVVAIDVLFLGPSPNDQEWKSAIDRYRDKLVIAMNFSDDPLNGTSSTLSIPSISLLPEQDPFDQRLGYVNYCPVSDYVVLKAQYRTNIDSINHNPGAGRLPKFYSFAARALQKGGHADLIPDDLAARSMRYAGSPLHSFKNYSLYEIFDPDYWKSNFHDGDYFRDKIVVVGPQGDFVKDKSSTPYGLMDGAEIHLNAINDLLQNEFLHPASDGLIFSTVIGSGLAALLLALTIAQIVWRFLAAVVVLAGYAMVLIWAYNGPGWLLPAVAPIGVFCGATGVGFVYDFTLAQIERFRLRTTFERYNSKNVVKYLMDHTESYKEMLAGTRRPVTALFSDVRGFTTMAEEAADSHRLVAKLNEYLTAMVACVFRLDGTLDSFMGDGIMAVWGNTPFHFGPREDAVRAVRAALAMIVELRKLNAKWLAEGGTAWRIGIGLNHGQVIVGDIGSQEHKEFATIGDAVNLASRLESLTKEYRLEILLGESVADLVRDHFHLRSVDIVQVKGKMQAVQAFTVLGEKSEVLSVDQQKFLTFYEEGMSSFRKREFARAKELFAQALQTKSDDYLAAQYLESCLEFAKNPPDASWTGIRVMTQK
jgi:adenylate cyclase